MLARSRFRQTRLEHSPPTQLLSSAPISAPHTFSDANEGVLRRCSCTNRVMTLFIPSRLWVTCRQKKEAALCQTYGKYSTHTHRQDRKEASQVVCTRAQLFSMRNDEQKPPPPSTYSLSQAYMPAHGHLMYLRQGKHTHTQTPFGQIGRTWDRCRAAWGRLMC